MKKLLILAMMAFTFGANAQTFPQPSPLAKVYQVVGLNEMEIVYSSPAVRERKVFGEMLPNNELWRTGANSATKLTASDKFMVGDKVVEAGSYSIFTIPAEKDITFILNSDENASGGSYDETKDVARVKVPFNTSEKNMERLQFTFANTTPSGSDIMFRWADRSFVVPVKVMTDEAVKMNYDAKLKEYEGEFSLYSEAANYYLETGNNKLALEMAKKSTDLNKKFWNTHTLAKAYVANGDKKNAKIAAEESLKLAQEANYDHYIKLNEKMISEL
ncbi:DUF2911 domain-containing protein [Cryomorpha ignava]|uniref:DUF2911 domain-containing protein n=1 Tax=Cryomorpha ignava TaxID=101383 RepID=A0A7K3WR96_9FLAO|nr:DUF2911 domain-containing protein [Cryomorpha ignava]NEN23994.1 DUF2911 domain-containing protein [Cryomorpha ignava]